MSQQYQTIILATGTTLTIQARGRVFACDSSTGNFGIRFDNSAEITGSSKRVFGSSTSPEFSRVTIRNTAGVQNTILFAISQSDIKIEQNISSVIATITVAAQTNAPTYSKGTNGLVGGGGTAFSGVDGAAVRKSFSVFNNEAAGSGNNIVVAGANGNGGHVVTPQTSYCVESGAAITLTGSGLAYYVMEIFYT